jgi:hypothetical protein
MNNKITKIPVTKNMALGFIYLNSYNHHLLYMKSQIMSKELKRLQKLKPKEYSDREVNNLSQELIRIELICNTVHYAEVFASVLLAMKKHKQISKFLLEYQVSEIKQFYKDLPKRKPQYIAKILQYPYPNKYVDKTLHKDLKITISQAHAELKKLSKFYLRWQEFYNSYKHGFRTFSSWPDEKSDDTMTGYFAEKGKLDSFKVVIPQKHMEDVSDLCIFMLRFLDNAQKMFSQRVLEQKKEFSMTLLQKNPKKTSTTGEKK